MEFKYDDYVMSNERVLRQLLDILHTNLVVDEYDVTVLPNEIVLRIVRMAIASDIAMRGTINRVSSAFREIANICDEQRWSAFAF